MFNFGVVKPSQPLSDPESVLKSAQTLFHISNVYALFPSWHGTRARCLKKIEEACREQLSGIVPDQLDERELERLIHYQPLFDQCSDSEAVQRVIRRILMDAVALRLPVMQKSSHGLKGPTLLVDVPEVEINTDNQPVIDSWRRAVIKWTNWSEIASSRLYDFFSRSFKVPQGIAIDFKQKQIIPLLQGQSQSIEDRTCEQMQQCFASMKARFPVEDSSDTEIMISEKIVGENLFDFALSKYEQLSQPQKERLFFILAKMAVLDLIFGNLDRFASIDWNEEAGQYIFEAFEANLGNAMVKWEGDSSSDFQVFAIDNENEYIMHEEQYRLFLQKLFTDSDVQEEMAENMVQNFEHGLNNHGDDLRGRSIEKSRAKLEVFAGEARTLGKAAFIKGIGEVLAELPDRISKWNGPEGERLRDYLRIYSPRHLEIIQKRIQGFESLKK